MEQHHTPDRSTAIDKALDILFHLHVQGDAQGVSDVARALSMPKSTAHRCLSALRRRALVEQDGWGRYHPGFGLVELAAGLLDREAVVAAAHPVLERAAASTGDTHFLVAARAGRLLVLDKAEGTGLLRVSPPIGSEVPPLATAAGKLYLAHASELLGPHAPTRFTRRTILDPDTLAAEVARAGSRGFAVNDQEWIEGLGVVAAPVLAEEGIVGVVCTAMPSARLSALGCESVANRIIAAADEVAARIGAQA